MLVVRELTGGLYFGQPKGRQVDRRAYHGRRHHGILMIMKFVGWSTWLFNWPAGDARKSLRWIKPMYWKALACGGKSPWK